MESPATHPGVIEDDDEELEDERRRWRRQVLLAACAILFLSIGARQGFGLLMAPTLADASLTRGQFSLAVATQYLVWGLASPVAGLLADRWGARCTLAAGGALYALGWVAASLSQGPQAFWWSAGVMIGLGLGGASFGVVHAVVAAAFPPQRRATALGRVGAATALGQLLMLLFTDWSLNAFHWREAMLWHAVAVAGIVIASYFMQGVEAAGSGPKDRADGPGAAGPAHPSAPTGVTYPSAPSGLSHPSAPSGRTYPSAPSGLSALAGALRSRRFWLLALPFAFSGFQVMATMTHLPALVADLSFPADTALSALVAVSATAFAGSWALGRLADRYRGPIVLACVYAVRAVLALVLAFCPLTPAGLVVLFLVTGLFWMSPIPLSSALCAQWFGTKKLASIFSAMFFFHQLGGFAGTWLAALVRNSTQSYRPMWLVAGCLCALGALLVAAAGRTAPAPPDQ